MRRFAVKYKTLNLNCNLGLFMDTDTRHYNLLTVIPYLDADKVQDIYKTTVPVDNKQWTDVADNSLPPTKALLYADSEGLHVKFKVLEKNPRAIYKNHMDRVCEDSAVELFLAFPVEPTQDRFKAHLDINIYMNIEINANGACYAKYGRHRKNRTALSDSDLASLNIKSNIEESMWTVEFTVPRALVSGICSFDPFAADSMFAFNIYKISESKDIEHYASFSKVESETPNFHLPESFALACIKNY